MRNRTIAVIGGLHFFVDLYAGFFAVYMVIAGLDPVRAALISSFSSLLFDGLQPALGYLADRVRGKLPVVLGVLISSLCLSSIGLTRDYSLLFALILAGRLGLALFHPAGANIASAAGAHRKERSFSLFITIGTVGASLSQPYFSLVTGWLGLSASPLLALPAVLLALGFLVFSRVEITGPEQRLDVKAASRILLQRFAPILLLFLIMTFRHGFFMTLTFFCARIFADWGFPRLTFSLAPAFLSLAGAAGVLVSGQIAHHLSARRIMALALLGYLPFMALFILAGRLGAAGPAFLALATVGFILNLAHIPNVTMGHRIIPEMTSMVSGLLMGLAWAVGNLGQPLAASFSGFFPWAPGVLSGIILLASFNLAALLLSRFLPSDSR